MGRYTLKAKIENLNSFTIKLLENDVLKDKVSLMTIDSFTIGNKPTFILRDLGFSEATLKGKIEFYISYISKGQEKHLDVIFNDAHNLRDIASRNERVIGVNNSKFIEFIDKTFLPLIVDFKFRKFLLKQQLITWKLEEWVENYLSDNYDLEFCYRKILEYASNYKQFRALVMGVELYTNPDFLDIESEEAEPIEQVTEERPYYERFVLSELGSDMDPDKGFALFSEEELRKYGESLDSLPDECFESKKYVK